MLTLLHRSHQIRFPSRVLVSLFSTKILTHSPPPLPCPSSSTGLCERVKIIRDPRASVVPVLEQWVREGKPIKKQQLQSLVRLMRNYNRFNHALEISCWMTDCRHLALSPSDAATRIELIQRVNGLVHAENFFEKLSSNLQTDIAYNALLQAYVRDKSVQKAEAVMQTMRDKGMLSSSLPYNTLIDLYTQTGNIDKINPLMHEMERKGIRRDNYTMRSLMAAYVAKCNISGMESILNEIEKDPQLELHWKVYSQAANGYLKVGQTEMALKMLKKMEGMMMTTLKGKKSISFNYLLSHYAKVGNKVELYRVWNTYKPTGEVTDTSHSCMISSLSNLDDIEGAEKIFEEWESRCTMYDFRVLNRLLVAYCKRGFFEKAELAIEKAVQGRTPYASTWNIMAMGYVDHNQMPKAVDMMKRAMIFASKGWKPSPDTLTACLEFLEGQGDVAGMEEIIRLLKKLGLLTRDIVPRLLKTCMAAGKPVTDVLDQMKMDRFAVEEGTNKSLKLSLVHSLQELPA